MSVLNTKGIYATTLSSWLCRIIFGIVQILNIRVLSFDLPPGHFAIFVVCSSIQYWFSLSDFGLSFYLQNIISKRSAENRSFNNIIKIAFLMISVVIIILTPIIYQLSSIFATIFTKGLTQEKNINNIVYLAGITGIYLSYSTLCTRVLYGLNKGYLANLIIIIGQITGHFLLRCIKPSDSIETLNHAILYWSLPQIIIPFIFLTIKINAIPTQNFYRSTRYCYIIFKNSIKYGFFMFFNAASLQVDYLILGNLGNSSQVIEYNLSSKLILSIYWIYNAALSAYYPYFTANFIRRDYVKIKLTINKLRFFGFFVMLLGTIFVLVFRHKLSHYIAPNYSGELNPKLIMWLGAYWLFRSIIDIYSIFLQCNGRLQTFLYAVPIQAILCITLMCFLIPKFGTVGVPLSLFIALLFTLGWTSPKFAIKLLNSIKGVQQS